MSTTFVQRTINYMRNNPVATYLIGGILIAASRESQVQNYYTKNFHRFDVERRQELE